MSDGQSIGAKRREFRRELIQRINDPGQTGMPGSPAEKLRHLANVVFDAHELDSDGTCVSHFDSREEQREWPCDEVIRMGRIFGVWWSRA